jgi:putative MATE family efflux protein
MSSSHKHKAIIALSFPIIGGMISQNVVNIVDTAMVGQVGTSALASVGLGSFLNFFCSALVMGLAVGVQTQTARLRGAGEQQYAIPLNGGLSLSTLISLPLCFLLIWQTPNLMALVTESDTIAQEGSVYLQARLIGMVALGANFAFRSYWSAVEKAHFYLFTLIVMHSSNILLNWVLIFGHWGMPAMGVEGAGYGTAISMWIGLVIHICLAFKHALPFGFLKGLPSRSAWKELLTMSLPSGIERMFFCLGYDNLYDLDRLDWRS